jgi:hypothetical protein
LDGSADGTAGRRDRPPRGSSLLRAAAGGAERPRGGGGLAGLLPSALQFVVTSDLVFSSGFPGSEQPGQNRVDPFLWNPPPVAAAPADGGGRFAHGTGVFGGFPSLVQVMRPPHFSGTHLAQPNLLGSFGVARRRRFWIRVFGLSRRVRAWTVAPRRANNGRSTRMGRSSGRARTRSLESSPRGPAYSAALATRGRSRREPRLEVAWTRNTAELCLGSWLSRIDAKSQTRPRSAWDLAS